MDSKIRIGIVGYGNLGRGVELAVAQNADMQLAAGFTRRDPGGVRLQMAGVPVHGMGDVARHCAGIDVRMLCGGSKDDLPVQGPQLARLCTTVDSFDTHAKIPEYFAEMDQIARQSGHCALISIGWDPGLFSVQRLLGDAVLPAGETYTFWGEGVSQGHSDAIRRIEGVADAKQYTVPCAAALDAVRAGKNPQLQTREKHTRVCYVVAKDGADTAAIETAIQTMPNYFADYDTTVHFISQETLNTEHSGMRHGGFVLIEHADPHAEPAQLDRHVGALCQRRHVALPIGEGFLGPAGIGTDAQRPADMVQDDRRVGEGSRQVDDFGELRMELPGLE